MTRFLVDATVLSEATKPQPSERVVDWLRRHEPDIAVDPVILGEFRFEILLLAADRRRARLDRWFDEGVARLQCIPWDAPTGLRWAQLLADLRSSGRAMPVKDSLIAATALTHDLTVATLNRRDFEAAGVTLVDPATADAV
jgi:predicted nucleic acid-binding protein